MPQDKDTHCPLVKADGTVCGHARYDAKGKPFEVRSSLFFWYDLGCVAFFTHSSLSVLVRHFYSLITFIFVVWNDWQEVYYFPIKDKLQALLKIPEFRKLLNHEFLRPRGRGSYSDVYDAPAWKDLMGIVRFPNNRIGSYTWLLIVYSFCFGLLGLFCLLLMPTIWSPATNRSIILRRRDSCFCGEHAVTQTSRVCDLVTPTRTETQGWEHVVVDASSC